MSSEEVCFLAPPPVRGSALSVRLVKGQPRNACGRRRQPCTTCQSARPMPSSSPKAQASSASSFSDAGGTPAAASAPADATTTALEREGAADRYVDLRTLKKVGWGQVRIASGPAPGCRFGPGDDTSTAVATLPQDVLFGPDTIPLSATQQSVVRALLARRSVLYSSISPERNAIVLDIAHRACEWNQTVVYCAPTRRAAEAMYAVMCNHMHGPSAICIELGYESTAAAPRRSKSPTVVITVPHVLRRALVDMDAYWWIIEADVFFLDNLLMPGIPEWEEILLGMPSRCLLCIFASDLSEYERDELPLWLETVQNSVVPVSPAGALRLWDRVDRPANIPLLRAFIFNAALHRHPVQVSIPLAAEELKKELELAASVNSFAQKPASRKSGSTGRMDKTGDRGAALDALIGDDKVDYASALLHGVQVIAAEDLDALCFEDKSHEQYADVAALVVADAKETSSRMKTRPGRRKVSAQERKKTPAAMNAAASRRRRRSESVLLPALVLVHGRAESEAAAGAVLAALHEASEDIVYDSDAADLLNCVISEFETIHSKNLTKEDEAMLFGLKRGIGMAHAGMLPALRMLSEELFVDGLVSVLVADTYLGPRELASLPRARSVLVQASSIAEQSDGWKGLVKGTIVGSLAGRPGLDEIGNMIALWFDDEIGDAEASNDVAASLLVDDLTPREAQIGLHAPGQIPLTSHVDALFNCRYNASSSHSARGSINIRRQSGGFLASYRGLLGTLRRHNSDGYKTIASYTLDSYRGWLVGAAMCATREKIELEKRAVDEKIEHVNWDELALHDRLEAKLTEHLRILETMDNHKRGVLAELMYEELRGRQPGSLIGIQCVKAVLDDSRELLLAGASSSQSRDLRSSVAANERLVDPNSTDNECSSMASQMTRVDVDVEQDAGVQGVLPAVLVAVIDNSRGQAQPSVVKSKVLVVCITLDGLWTLVPVEDVTALDSKSAVIPNVDLMSIPHLATFDLDPITGWAKCKPCSEPEISRVSSVLDQAVTEVLAGDKIAVRLTKLKLPELRKQEKRVESARMHFLHSPWYGRDLEIAEFRRFRRRSVKLGDDSASIRNSEKTLEIGLRKGRRGFDERLRAQLAVLEDCNAVSVPGDGELEMTPIGVLASVLPGAYPLFGAACLLLVSRLDELSPAELCGFISVTLGVSPPFLNKSKNEFARSSATSMGSGLQRNDAVDDVTSLQMSNASFQERSSGEGSVYDPPSSQSRGLVREVDDLEGVLPLFVLQEMDDIRRALLVVHRRHFSTENPLNPGPQIAPARLEVGMARALHHFVDGSWSWSDVVQKSDSDIGELVSAFRNVLECLNVMRRDEAGLGELADVLSIANSASDALRVWPVSDISDLEVLTKYGVGVRQFLATNRNSTYKSWWARAKDEVEVADQRADGFVQSVQAEVVSSSEIEN